MFDFDLVFYMYCVKMRMSEQGFWDSPFCKVMKLIDMYKDEMMMQASAAGQVGYAPVYFNEEPGEIHSMREVEGFI